MLIPLIIAVIAGGTCVWLAADKHRDTVAWAVGGVLFGVLAVLVLALANPLPDPHDDSDCC
jgi:hypothetical protein